MSALLPVGSVPSAQVSVSQRGDGRWRVRWREQGRVRERTFGADGQGDAERFAAEVAAGLQRVEGDVQVADAADGLVTWGEIFERWKSAKRQDWSKAAAQQNDQLLTKWALPWLGDLPIGQITGECYQQLFAHMAEQNRLGSRARVRSLLSQLEKWAADNNYRPPRNFPLRGFRSVTAGRVQGAASEYVPPRLRPDSRRVTVLREKLVEADVNRAWWRALHTDIAAYCGLRLGETFALRSCHVDPQTRRIQVRHQYVMEPGVQAFLKDPKNGKERTAILLPSLVPDVQRRLAEVRYEDDSPPCEDCSDPGCGLLFPAPFGGPHDRSHFGKMARDAFALTWEHEEPSHRWPRGPNGGWLWSWRDLRHHAAVVLLDQFGLPPAQAALLLGHSEEVLLKRYYGPQEDAIEQALKATA